MTRQEIINQVHSHRGFFEDQCRILASRVEAFAKRVVGRCESQRARLIERLGETAFHAIIVDRPGYPNGYAISPAMTARDEECKADPPGPGLVWQSPADGYCSHLDYWAVTNKFFAHWRPIGEDDRNPLLWFPTARETWPSGHIDQGWRPKGKGNLPPDDQRLHDAVLLAIAHDLDPSLSAGEPRILDAVERGPYWNRDDFCRQVWNAFGYPDGGGLIERTWEQVKLEVESSAMIHRPTPPAGKQQHSDSAAQEPEAPPAAMGQTDGKAQGELDPFADLDDDLPLSVKSLAELSGLAQEPLRKRLERERAHDHRCFVQTEGSRRKNDPQYLYIVKYVRPIIRELKSSQKVSDDMSDERPTKENLP